MLGKLTRLAGGDFQSNGHPWGKFPIQYKTFFRSFDCMQTLGIPVVIISGGLKPYVEETLAPYRDRLLHIYSVALDTSGPFMKLHTEYEGESDLLEKRAVMARYTYERAICVGDSLTDLRMAMQFDVVFARDTLAQLLREREIPFTRWEDFYDVCRGVASLTS